MEYISGQKWRGMPTDYVTATLLSTAIWVIIVVIYRLYLHPLARFPGSKLVAITYWVEFYLDVVKAGGGQYYKRVNQMHHKHGKEYDCFVRHEHEPNAVPGPIIRVSPNELHIDDPEYYQVLFAGGGEVRHC